MPQRQTRTGYRQQRSYQSYDSRYVSGYIDGNTVRKPVPQPYEEIPSKQDKRRQEQSREKDKKLNERRKAAAKNRAKELKIDLRYTMFLATAVAVVFVACIYYLGLQSQITNQNKSIAALKSELTSLTDSNQATQERLNNAIDLQKVYEVATGELGMDYPKKKQIFYYDGSGDDYVKQYKSIPQSGE